MVPKSVDIMTWFAFLLSHGVRPYQRAKGIDTTIGGLAFTQRRSTRGVSESDTEKYYLRNGDIYPDKVSRFIVECNRLSGQAVLRRLSAIYTDIFIDEFQDLAGWDWDVIKLLLDSGIRVTLVGDPRQHIYSTNPSPKNRKYLGIGVLQLVKEWERQGTCEVQHMNQTHRCGDGICRFTNKLWPVAQDMTRARPEAPADAEIRLVHSSDVPSYVERYAPQLLRHDRRAPSHECEAMNFGISKGLQFDHVLIVPTKPIREFLATGDLAKIEKSREKLYVAATRARHSVAFVFDGKSAAIGKPYQLV
jgi:DNA helicase-2/ATP-dependent DNA helicase PcrA